MITLLHVYPPTRSRSKNRAHLLRLQTVREIQASMLVVGLHDCSFLYKLHSAGHLLDICLPRIGLSHLEAGKAYHFPDGGICCRLDE
ncbi:hypothetical protein QN277_027575 [Acacia crassicarpa]|uniref:Uncharacterized protein n=1 Tax=Acacia crassicarpa TaxID=499986 RepID=A0AAE1MM59_9FABA|nr:hypothetical protein QN277_027575 [Acacia crassicarpa]